MCILYKNFLEGLLFFREYLCQQGSDFVFQLRTFTGVVVDQDDDCIPIVGGGVITGIGKDVAHTAAFQSQLSGEFVVAHERGDRTFFPH